LADCWYQEGLRFSCTRCGGCCRGDPGYVWVAQRDIEAMAKALRMPVRRFTRRYLRKVGDRYSLVELPNGDCVFYGDGCAVYEARPVQCRTFPFWPEYVTTPRGWAAAARRCPGVGTGRLFTAAEIEARLCELRVNRAAGD